MRPLLILALLAAPAAAQDFRDDRSDPAAIVASLYDAIGRHQYARAWSYFGDEKPVADYQTFAKGYAGTASVRLQTGEVFTEGAAGSVYGLVPVSLEATATDGAISVFAGCYVTRQVRPELQEPPFRPMEIVRGRLVPRDMPFE